MKRSTGVCSGQVGKENRQFSNYPPTKRKGSINTPNILTMASFKGFVQMQLKSTSDSDGSLSTISDKKGKKSHESSLQLDLSEESCYDSLEQYEKKPKPDPMLTKLVALRGIFSAMATLRELEGDRIGKRQLSVIQNDLLSLERELMRE